jgi:hypothetical protein
VARTPSRLPGPGHWRLHRLCERDAVRARARTTLWPRGPSPAAAVAPGPWPETPIRSPLAGEGGCTPSQQAFLSGLRQLCDEAGALLVFDEVQCGLGRTGKLWGYQNYGVEPDIMTLAKPLAGGLPIGAVLMKQHVADVMAPGDHGSTFAGNPLVCHTACTVFDIVASPDFLAGVDAKGERLRCAGAAGERRRQGGAPRCAGCRPPAAGPWSGLSAGRLQLAVYTCR